MSPAPGGRGRAARLLGLVVLTAAVGLFASPARATEIPADERLLPVRDRLDQIVEQTRRAGLPADVLVSKIREGLAKGVDPARIEAATSRLATSLKNAHGFVAARRDGQPAAELVQALAEAELAGVELAATDRLVRADAPTAQTKRGVEVLTDLALRGYPTARASAIVSQVLRRDPKAVGRVSATLEEIRHGQALTHVEASDALEAGLGSAGTLEAARGKAVAEARKSAGKKPGGPGKAGRGNAGRADFVPPGLLKKPGAGAPKSPPDKPGRGRN